MDISNFIYHLQELQAVGNHGVWLLEQRSKEAHEHPDQIDGINRKFITDIIRMSKTISDHVETLQYYAKRELVEPLPEGIDPESVNVPLATLAGLESLTLSYLKRGGISTIIELLSTSDQRLLEIHQIGPLRLNEIHDALRDAGLRK